MLDIENRQITLSDKTFGFIDVTYIEALNYYIDYDEFGEKVSFLEISFLLDNGVDRSPLKLKFTEVTNLNLKGFGYSYNQIVGFDIVDTKDRGWVKEMRYHVTDYENSRIDFYCAEITVIA